MKKETILFTGFSGFVGKNTYNYLSNFYNIDSLGLSQCDTYCHDLSKGIPEFKRQYDIVIHGAGMAHQKALNKNTEKLFFEINLNGTKNLCFGLEKVGYTKAFIYLSTVSVYGLDKGINISEDHPLNGKTPYALSKIAAESFLQEWCPKHNINLGILRPSLIAGPFPPGNLGAMIQGIKSGKYLRIGNGDARKSILMAEDIARLVPKLIEKGGIYNVCDDYNPSFKEIEDLIADQLGKKSPFSVPHWGVKALAIIGDAFGEKFPINSIVFNKIVNSLTFSNSKAKHELSWQPLDVLSNFKIK